MTQQIQNIIETNNKFRKEYAIGDLFTLDDIKIKTWNYEAPTLTNIKNKRYRINYECMNDILEELPFFGKLDFSNSFG